MSMTILNAPEFTEVIVLEMGMRGSVRYRTYEDCLSRHSRDYKYRLFSYRPSRLTTI